MDRKSIKDILASSIALMVSGTIKRSKHALNVMKTVIVPSAKDQAHVLLVL